MADTASIVAGAGAAISALASAIVSATKSGRVAEDLAAAKTELIAKIAKVEENLLAKINAAVQPIPTLRDEVDRLTRRVDRRSQQPSQPSGAYLAIEPLHALMARMDDVERRLMVLESSGDSGERRADKLDVALDALAREAREAIHAINITVAKLATRIDERTSRRTRGSDG